MHIVDDLVSITFRSIPSVSALVVKMNNAGLILRMARNAAKAD